MNDITTLIDNHAYVIPIAFVLIAVSIMVITFYYSSKNVIIREFKKSRKKSINSIRDNEYAKVVGIAKHANLPLIAPLSGRACVYYHVVVEVKTDKNWRRIINDVKTQDFFIETNTEMAIVKASTTQKNASKCFLVKDYKKNTGFGNDAPEKIEAYLRANRKKSTSVFVLNKTIRYYEGVIEPNEKIGVKGIAKWKVLKQPIEGYSYSRILTLEGVSKKEKLLITDEPKALMRVQNKL